MSGKAVVDQAMMKAQFKDLTPQARSRLREFSGKPEGSILVAR